MEDLPIRDVRHATAEQALAILKLALPAEWILREQEGQKDYGIDVEIELADSRATGRIFKGQVKGHNTLGWTVAGTNLQQVKASTLAYWRAMPIPVVMFLVDVSGDRVYWAPATGPSAEPTGIRIARDSALPETSDRLKWHVVNWIDETAQRRPLYGLPLLVQRLEKRRAQVGYDLFLPVDDNDDLHELAALYEQVTLVRRAVGLSFANMLPWALWLARSQRIFGDEYELYWGVYDEVMAYLDPLADEAVARSKVELRKEEATPENAAAKALAHGQHWAFRFHSALDNEDDEFWRKVDHFLEAKGAKKLDAATPPRRR